MFRAASAGPKKIITANRLGDGRVVFLDVDGGWTMELVQAHSFSDGPDLDAANAYAAEQHRLRIVVEPYAVDVDVKEGVPMPVRLRERIRADGPTIEYGYEERARLERETLGTAAE
jgi:hypothetical protein